METLQFALVQFDPLWESPEANRGMLEELLSEVDPRNHVVVLPEMFTTGFTMNAMELAEPENFTTLRWMKLMAARLQMAVTGSYIVKTKTGVFNRMYWVTPEQEAFYYDKRHLFRMAGEDHHFQSGDRRVIVNYRDWRLALFVCYDLRFPVWSRNAADADSPEYDIALYVANWPEARVNAWEILLQARAMENSCYVVGVNRIGEDALNIRYNGRSLAAGPKGIITPPTSQHGIFYARFRKPDLLEYREKFPVHLDGDDFIIQ